MRIKLTENVVSRKCSLLAGTRTKLYLGRGATIASTLRGKLTRYIQTKCVKARTDQLRVCCDQQLEQCVDNNKKFFQFIAATQPPATVPLTSLKAKASKLFDVSPTSNTSKVVEKVDSHAPVSSVIICCCPTRLVWWCVEMAAVMSLLPWYLE